MIFAWLSSVSQRCYKNETLLTALERVRIAHAVFCIICNFCVASAIAAIRPLVMRWTAVIVTNYSSFTHFRFVVDVIRRSQWTAASFQLIGNRMLIISCWRCYALILMRMVEWLRLKMPVSEWWPPLVAASRWTRARWTTKGIGHSHRHRWVGCRMRHRR